jgi:energy-coupling factor transporter ATP-binding protein EcfA2
MIVLPTQIIPAKTENPRFLILFGKPKSGKTTIAAAIPNNLILDLEGGSEYIDALNIQARTYTELAQIAAAIKQKYQETGVKPYKYITIDSGTMLQDIARTYGLRLYQNTPMALKKDGTLYNDDILKLPKGAGYLYLREAFEKMYSVFFDLCDHLILICHCKDSQIDKDGKEVTEMSIDLSGQLARLTAASADAIGYVYRQDHKTLVSFKTNGDVIAGARPKHLKEQEIIVAESNENHDVTVYWDRIFKEDQNLQNTALQMAA